MENTFLQIGSRIVMVEWGINYSYDPGSYKRWKEIRYQGPFGEDEKEIELEYEELGSVVCSSTPFPIKISIVPTRKNEDSFLNTTEISGNEYIEITNHIKKHSIPSDILANAVYVWLIQNENIPY